MPRTKNNLTIGDIALSKVQWVTKEIVWLCPDNCALFLNYSVAFYVKRLRCCVTVFCVLHAKAFKKKTRNTLSVFCCECSLFSVLFCALFTYDLTKLFL